MKDIKYSLVNFSNSFLKHFNANTFHDTIPEIDNLLKGHKKVVVLLFDGMGRNIIRKHLKETSFIRSHYIQTINSTFPPTTAAATTTFFTGKNPVETGWIAWDAYFKEYDRNIILFTGEDYNTGEKLGRGAARELLPYISILELINKAGTTAIEIQRKPILPNGPDNLLESYEQLTNVLKENDECFVYYYFDSPDKEMHENGIDDPLIRSECEEIDSFVERLVKENPDTMFFTFADHGHINVKYLDLCDHPELLSMLYRKVGSEKRNSMFFVKPEYIQDFKELFNKLYGGHFLLLSKEEMYKNKIYGEGLPNPHLDSMLGDYIAISQDEYSILASKEFTDPDYHKGHHAGGTEEEMLIDISVFNK